MAITPTTITCCRISEKFCSVRKRSFCVAKNRHAKIRAINGPSVPMGGSLALRLFMAVARPIRGKEVATTCPAIGEGANGVPV
ncbi:hypothetical protein D9M69_665290 [compost metagenome]